MTDTLPEVAERFRRLLRSRSGEERLKMGSSMHATAAALVRASVLARDPQASPGSVRQALFLRFYGHEFGLEARERILARLGRDETEGTGEPKRVPVDWDSLEMALTANSDEWTCYLDVQTGEVTMLPGFGVDTGEDGPSEEEIEEWLETGRLIHVEPLGSSVEYEWMEEFTATVAGARLRGRLEAALGRSRPFRRFKDALLDGPAERERWFRFREERTRAAAREWLADHGIEPTTAPPERGSLRDVDGA